MEKEKDYNMMDMLKFNSGYAFGWKISRLENNTRLIRVLQNVKRYNPSDSFCHGIISGFENGRTQQTKTTRLSELDKVLQQSKENQKDLDIER